jgi:VanZ family protein
LTFVVRLPDVSSAARERAVDLMLWLLAASCAATTLWFSFVAVPPGATLFAGADKLGHAIAYFVTTMSFLFAAVWRPGRGEGRLAREGVWFPVAAVAAGAMIEVIQGLTPARAPEVADVAAEIVGAASAVALQGFVRARSERHRAPDP